MVFVGPDGRRFGYWTLSRVFRRLVERARSEGLDLPSISLKGTRSTFATALGRVASARDIAEALGHADGG